MKSILRIVIILVASAIVSGITWAIVEAGDTSTTLETSGEVTEAATSRLVNYQKENFRKGNCLDGVWVVGVMGKPWRANFPALKPSGIL